MIPAWHRFQERITHRHKASEVLRETKLLLASEERDKQISRRTFLKYAGLGSAALAGGLAFGRQVFPRVEAIPSSTYNTSVEPGSLAASNSYILYPDTPGANYFLLNGHDRTQVK